jgi:hypothetical protein
MPEPDKNTIPFSPLTAIVLIGALLLIPLLLAGFFSG